MYSICLYIYLSHWNFFKWKMLHSYQENKKQLVSNCFKYERELPVLSNLFHNCLPRTSYIFPPIIHLIGVLETPSQSRPMFSFFICFELQTYLKICSFLPRKKKKGHKHKRTQCFACNFWTFLDLLTQAPESRPETSGKELLPRSKPLTKARMSW